MLTSLIKIEAAAIEFVSKYYYLFYMGASLIFGLFIQMSSRKYIKKLVSDHC